VLRQILVIQTAFIGDAILASCLPEAIHRHNPEIAIDILVRKGNEGLFAQHPYIRNVIVWDKKAAKYRSLLRVLQSIRKTRYDSVLNCQRFAASGFLTAFSKATFRIGFEKNPFSFLFSHRIKHRIEAGVHECTRNGELLKPLSILPYARPKLYPPEQSPIGTQNSYICISPASVWFTKQWPLEKWVEFCEQIPQQMHVYLLGGKGDSAICEALIQKSTHKHFTNLCDKLNLLESAALMRNAQMNYVNDSAPMHLASSVNAPVCAVYCSTIPGFGFGPLSDNAHCIETTENLACRPCGLHGKKACPEGHFSCAKTISADRLATLLQGTR
jgi:lipopolysaccharide heptosyltransferase II